MKRIFLTSGLVLCMACPALATPINNQCNVGNLLQSENGADVNLRAIWTNNQGTVTLETNYTFTGANCSTAVNKTTSPASNPLYTTYNTAVYSDNARSTAVTALSTLPTITGYTFGGYYVDSDTTFSGTQYIAPTTGNFHTDLKNLVSTPNGTATLSAKWTPNQHTITYSCGEASNNGTNVAQFVSGQAVNGTPININYDDCTTLAADTTCEAPGFTFRGWVCTGGIATGTSQSPTAAGTAVTYNSADADTTCTAQWGANTLDLFWEPGNGETITNPEHCTYGGTFTLPTEPERTGYTFGGWEVYTPSGN